MAHTTPSAVRITLKNLAGCDNLNRAEMADTNGGLSYLVATRRQYRFAAVRTRYGIVWGASYRVRRVAYVW